MRTRGDKCDITEEKGESIMRSEKKREETRALRHFHWRSMRRRRGVAPNVIHLFRPTDVADWNSNGETNDSPDGKSSAKDPFGISSPPTWQSRAFSTLELNEPIRRDEARRKQRKTNRNRECRDHSDRRDAFSAHRSLGSHWRNDSMFEWDSFLQTWTFGARWPNNTVGDGEWGWAIRTDELDARATGQDRIRAGRWNDRPWRCCNHQICTIYSDEQLERWLAIESFSLHRRRIVSLHAECDRRPQGICPLAGTNDHDRCSGWKT